MPLTLNDWRNMLSEDVQRLRKGDTTAASVNAVTNAMGKILSSVKLEVEVNRIMGRPMPLIPLLGQEALPIKKIAKGK